MNDRVKLRLIFTPIKSQLIRGRGESCRRALGFCINSHAICPGASFAKSATLPAEAHTASSVQTDEWNIDDLTQLLQNSTCQAIPSEEMRIQGEVVKIRKRTNSTYVTLVSQNTAPLDVRFKQDTFNSQRSDLIHVAGILYARPNGSGILWSLINARMIGKPERSPRRRIQDKGYEDLRAEGSRPLELTKWQLVKSIALVTAPGTDGKHDFQENIKNANISILPFEVACLTDINAICNAIRRAHQSTADAIAVVRGGGNVSDLMAFDDVNIARAIKESPIPIFVAIGHKSDQVRCVEFTSWNKNQTPSELGRWFTSRNRSILRTEKEKLREKARVEDAIQIEKRWEQKTQEARNAQQRLQDTLIVEQRKHERTRRWASRFRNGFIASACLIITCTAALYYGFISVNVHWPERKVQQRSDPEVVVPAVAPTPQKLSRVRRHKIPRPASSESINVEPSSAP